MGIGTIIGLAVGWGLIAMREDYRKFREENPPEPFEKRFPDKNHATWEPDNVYVEGKGWCKPR